MGDKTLPLNRRFASLDAYLLYLKTHSGPSDGHWYREIGPGLYQLETGNRRRIVAEGEQQVEPRRVFTREQLLKMFGFSK